MKAVRRLVWIGGVPVILFAVWAGLQVVEERAVSGSVDASQRHWDCLVEQDSTNPACRDPGIPRSEDADRCPHAVAVCRDRGLDAEFDAAIERVRRWQKIRALLLWAALLASLALALHWSWSVLKRRRASRSRPN